MAKHSGPEEFAAAAGTDDPFSRLFSNSDDPEAQRILTEMARAGEGGETFAGSALLDAVFTESANGQRAKRKEAELSDAALILLLNNLSGSDRGGMIKAIWDLFTSAANYSGILPRSAAGRAFAQSAPGYTPPPASTSQLYTPINTGPYQLRPDVLAKLAKPGPSEFKHYVNVIYDAVTEYNATHTTQLNATLMVNQIMQESSFRPDARGPRTKYGQALGIAQFLPSTAAQYGLGPQDLFDPDKALPAAVAHIGDMTAQYGSQELAILAYNGGRGAVEWVAKELGIPVRDLTSQQWMAYTAQRNAELGPGPSNLWRMQTRDYLEKIASTYWDPAKLDQSMQMTAQLDPNMTIATAGPKPEVAPIS